MAAQKTIGLWSCIAFAVGAMIGAGVFVLSGVAVQDAGPAALISFTVAGLGILCSALSFVAIASLAKTGELGYAPVGDILGHRFWGFITAWAFYVSATICTAFVMNAFGVYVHDFFIGSISPLVWAVAATALISLLNMTKTSEIGKVEGVLVLSKVLVLALFVVFGLMHMNGDTFRPFFPHGGSAVLSTTGVLFIAYLGFSVITNIAGDVKDARRTVPKAIIISILLVMTVYIGVVLALLTFPLPSYSEASVGQVAKHLMGPVGGVLVALAALVSTLSAANSNILGSSEIMVRLAARKDVPTVAGRLWNGHPIVSVTFAMIISIALLLSRKTGFVISLANVAAIAAIALINIAAIRLTLHKAKTHVRIPGGPIVPSLGLLSCIIQLFLLGKIATLTGFCAVGLGGLLYLSRRRLHSREHHQRLTRELETSGGPALRWLRKIEKSLSRPTAKPS